MWHFWTPTNPKPNKSRITTLLTLPDHMEDCSKIQKHGALWIISAWKWFQNLPHSKLQKMAEKPIFMVFRVLFLFGVHIQQRWYLTGGNASWCIIRRRKTYHFKIKKSIMVPQKWKIILLYAALKDFWSSADLKLKMLSLSKFLLP